MVKMMGSFTMPLLEPRRQLTTNRGSKINPQRFHLGRTNRNLLRYTTVSLEKKEKSMAKSQDLKPRHQLLGLSVSQFHLWHHWSWWISCRRPGAYHLRICAFLGLGFPNINIQKPGAPCRKLPKLHFQRTPVRLPWPSNPSLLVSSQWQIGTAPKPLSNYNIWCHFSGNFWKTHQVSPPRSCVFRCTSRNSNGRRVTTPPPRGRKSRPTMDSINELLPRLKRLPLPVEAGKLMEIGDVTRDPKTNG